MNKQEENIVDILTYDEIEDVAWDFILKLYETDRTNAETVALISNKRLVEYTMNELLKEGIVVHNIKKVELGLDDDEENCEYMISVNVYGSMIVQPITLYWDKHFSDIDFAFVDMDGNVEQTTIDMLINRDVKVVLFGYEDDCEEEGYTVNGKSVTKEEFDAYVSKFTIKKNEPTVSNAIYKVNGTEVSKEDYEKALNELDEKYLDNVQDMLLDYFDFVEEMNKWRRLL